MKTVSLELSKRIAELEVGKVESEYQWRIDWIAGDGGIVKEEAILVHGENYETKGTNENGQTCGTYLISAYTTDELLEQLQASTCMGKKTDIETKSIARYYVETFEHHSNNIHADTPAEALGLLYEYLLKEGIIKSKE